MFAKVFCFCCPLTLHTLVLLVVSVTAEVNLNHNHNVTPFTLENKDTNYHNNNNSLHATESSAAFAAAMSSLTTAAATIAANINADRNVVNCGNTPKMVDNCFRDLPPHLMEFLQSPKIVIDQQEIIHKCSVFHHGMKCFDEYTGRCVPEHNVKILNSNVEGARKFFTKFCNDPVFQKNYLKHKDCFSYIYDDWLHCHKQSQNIMSEAAHAVDTNVTEKFMEICCARYGYETCVFNSARYKCYKHSAKYAREMAKMLTNETQFQNCRQYEESMCSGGSSPTKFISSPFTYMGIVMLLWLMVIRSTTPEEVVAVPTWWSIENNK
ncbi:uncharacterized protein [Musca autumnalis]|uniref:uncharacterized protein n=1 Tax=Musca autumnalis TaxID=221902 RepID=UPI003CF061B2